MSMGEKIAAKGGVELTIQRRLASDLVEVTLYINTTRRCLLHWALSGRSNGPWLVPPDSVWPEGSNAFGSAAVQTPFSHVDDQGCIRFRLGTGIDVPGIVFALFFPEENLWDNNRGRDFYIPVRTAPERVSPFSDPIVTRVADEIIDHEMGSNSWTLMHRYGLCYDLVDTVRTNVEGLALIFVWLRFSAIRQLDWQRNYNTKPRELSHAIDRLAQRLAEIYVSAPASREFLRLISTTLGRGGEGQRIRDEILEIMHRHHIKEVAGHFMEEWHQKMHNNTTPDDVVICEAYLEFLRSSGNLDFFYTTLQGGAVTKERLESFDRPLTTPPDFVPHLKDALIHDFSHFLVTLKSVHNGTDLQTAITSAKGLLDAGTQELLGWILNNQRDPHVPLLDLVGKVTSVRRRLSEMLNTRQGGLNLLFLDLGLEAIVRAVVERDIHTARTGDELVELIDMALDNWRFSFADDGELSRCSHQWHVLKDRPRFSRDWSLHAKSVLDRMEQATASFTRRYQQVLQPKAEFLGHAFEADPWTITIFTEEVVRGSPAFVLSILHRHLDPLLRRAASLGNWQVISHGRGTGRIEVIDTLRSIQATQYGDTKVIITGTVKGEEEIPRGVVAIVTPQAVDVLSHVAIRARNSGVLFATCYDQQTIDRLRSLSGRLVRLTATGSGDVRWEQTSDATGDSGHSFKPTPKLRSTLSKPHFTAYAITSEEFNEGVVGKKSINLARLAGRLPDWIHVPVSVALPFGTFEKVLRERSDQRFLDRYNTLIRRVDGEPAEVLPELHKILLGLEAPSELPARLKEVMDTAGLRWPKDWENAWRSIKRVWASKWNERAYLSRKARGIPHEDLSMAVLIQRVVEAEYSFVIHTVNPLSDSPHELYAEVVLGLGETLVANYPGRALSFSFPKAGLARNPTSYSSRRCDAFASYLTAEQSKNAGEAQRAEILAYPSKSVGLYGGGLIFRSDSNGEDLSGYAGAGLYDSIMLEKPCKVNLDYTKEPLVWDDEFRGRLLASIAKIGIVVEGLSESPQDIEGAYASGNYFVVQTRPQVGMHET